LRFVLVYVDETSFWHSKAQLQKVAAGYAVSERPGIRIRLGAEFWIARSMSDSSVIA